MILDSSAVIAILMEEPEAEGLLTKFHKPGPIGIGVAGQPLLCLGSDFPQTDLELA